MLADWWTNGQTDGRTDNRIPISRYAKAGMKKNPTKYYQAKSWPPNVIKIYPPTPSKIILRKTLTWYDHKENNDLKSTYIKICLAPYPNPKKRKKKKRKENERFLYNIKQSKDKKKEGKTIGHH